MSENPRYSLVVPIYKNEGSIPALFDRLSELRSTLGGSLETILVIDGSPDASLQLTKKFLGNSSLCGTIISLTRNFGAWSAIRAGLAQARGDFISVMAADLQEPTDLVTSLFRAVSCEGSDVAVGARVGREDSFGVRLTSAAYWRVFRKLVNEEFPPGGVDMFACSRRALEGLLELDERESSLIGLLYWMGYRATVIPYKRQERKSGKSAWTFAARLRYAADGLFSFTAVPMRILGIAGLVGFLIGILMAAWTLLAKVLGLLQVPGYATTTILITLFGGIQLAGLSLLGEYLWRVLENTRRRPFYIIDSISSNGDGEQGAVEVLGSDADDTEKS